MCGVFVTREIEVERGLWEGEQSRASTGWVIPARKGGEAEGSSIKWDPIKWDPIKWDPIKWDPIKWDPIRTDSIGRELFG